MKNIGIIVCVSILGLFACLGMWVAKASPVYIGSLIAVIGVVLAIQVNLAWESFFSEEEGIFAGKEVTVYITEDKKVRGKMLTEPNESGDFIILRDAQVFVLGSNEADIRDMIAIPFDTITHMELENLDKIS